MTYVAHLTIFFLVYVTLSVGLNILVGYCGRLSLAHVVAFALGGYGFAYGTLTVGAGVVTGLAIGVAASSVLSLVYVLLTHKLHGDGYVLISLAIQSLSYSVMFNWYDTTRQFGTLRSFTNGPFGVTGMPAPDWTSGSIFKIAGLVAVVLVPAIAVTALVLRSNWGLWLKAMRDSEAEVSSLGGNNLRLHQEAVVLASSLAALAGGSYALYVSYVDPMLCSLDQAVLVLSMVIIGGSGNLRGPVVGALVLTSVPEALKFLPLSVEHVENLRVLLYGGGIVLAMHFRPQGLLGARAIGDTSARG